jgi:hypothetical protein
MYVLIDTTEQTPKILGHVVKCFRSFSTAVTTLFRLNTKTVTKESLHTLWYTEKKMPDVGTPIRFADEVRYRPLTPEEYDRMGMLRDICVR